MATFSLPEIRAARAQTLQFFAPLAPDQVLTLDMALEANLGIFYEDIDFLAEDFANQFHIQDADAPLIEEDPEVHPLTGLFILLTLPIMLCAKAFARFFTGYPKANPPYSARGITRNRRIQNHDRITIGDFAASLLYGKFVKREQVQIQIAQSQSVNN